MSKGLLITLIIVAVLVTGGCSVVSWAIGVKNDVVRLDQAVQSQWAQVENQYQRRADLIPNLVETVQGYARHEKTTLEAVIQARASATAVKIDPTNLTPEMIQQFSTAQAGLGGALSRLLVSIEKYPDLKASPHFRDLQAQLEGTENRIALERRRFNEATQAYNTRIQVFPGSLIVGDKPQKPFFKADEGAKTVPKIKFDSDKK